MPTLTPARLRRALLAAVLASCVVPASSSASFLLIGGNGDLLHNGTGERNSLSVRQVADALIVTDTSGLANHPGAGPPPRLCGQVDRQTMRCPTRFIRRVRSLMEAGEDTAGPINTHLPVEINGGDNADVYEAGNPSFLTNVDITSDGAARLLRGASRLTRKGKAVSARLALRLDHSLAGKRLRLEVEAIDVRGARQLERNAGSIRVAG